MRDSSVRQQLHLLLCSAHEYETTGVEQERWKILKAVGVFSIVADCDTVTKDKADLDNSGQTSSHQSVPEDAVYHGAQHERLRVSAHGPACEHDNDTRDQVPLGSSASVSREPHSDETSTPPDNSHTGVLKIVVYPRTAPSVLGKGVDNSPSGDNSAVEEFLASAGALNPELSDEKENSEEDAVRDECRTHDEVRQTLSSVISSAEPECDNSSKEHLDPGRERHSLSQYAVSKNDPSPDLPIHSSLQMQFEIDTHDELSHEHEHQPVCE